MTVVYERYPQLITLKGKVPDDIVEREVLEKAPRFDRYAPLAHAAIPSARLCDIFPAELERGAIRLENFLGQWGNISVEEVCKLALIAAWLKPQAVFEFGTYNGMTTLQLALNTPSDCVIHTVDIEPASIEASQLDVGDIDRHLAMKAGAFACEIGHYFRAGAMASKVRQIWGNSAKLDLRHFEKGIDMVFVDAGHTYEYVKADTQNALKMLRPGGVILWHDYMQLLHPDVTQALCELASSDLKIFHLRGTTLAVHVATGD